MWSPGVRETQNQTACALVDMAGISPISCPSAQSCNRTRGSSAEVAWTCTGTAAPSPICAPCAGLRKETIGGVASRRAIALAPARCRASNPDAAISRNTQRHAAVIHTRIVSTRRFLVLLISVLLQVYYFPGEVQNPILPCFPDSLPGLSQKRRSFPSSCRVAAQPPGWGEDVYPLSPPPSPSPFPRCGGKGRG